MKNDIHKLSAWIEKLCQEGVALEHEIPEWKLVEEKVAMPTREARAS